MRQVYSTSRYHVVSPKRIEVPLTLRESGTVMLESPDRFRMEGELSEGNKRVRLTQVGQLVASCPPS
jgi:hypothetical protein